MAYGIQIENKDGISLIDEDSKQVQIGKSGNVTPGGFVNQSHDSFVDTPYAPCVLLPKPLDETFLFCKVRQASGTNPNFFPFGCSFFHGTTTLTITKKSGGASGSNVFYADLSTGNVALALNGSSYTQAGQNSGITGSSFHDVGIDENITGTSSYVSGGDATAILLEDGGSYDVKVTLDKNLTSSIPNNTTFTMNKDLVCFARHRDAWTTGWVLDYKIGTITDNEEETGTHGMQVFGSDGVLAWSSNRENWLIDSVTTGNPDLGINGSGTPLGEADAVPHPRFAAEVGDTSNWEDYWTLITAYGFCCLTCTGNPDTYEGLRTWGAGYIWCPPNNGDYANSFITNNPWGSSNTLSKSSSNANGVCMAPVQLSQLTGSTFIPQVSQSAGVNDGWATQATRTLIIGHFI